MNDGAPDVAARAQKLVEALWSDGKMGASVRAKAKELFPDVTLPEDAISPIVAPMQEELATMRAQLAEERNARIKEREDAEASRQRATLEDSLASARARYGLTDEGFDKMVARMKATGNYSDAEASAAWVAQQEPVQRVNKADWLPKKIDLFGSSTERQDEAFRQLHTNPQGYLDGQLQEFVNDPDRYVRETFAA
jgi:hypothetical protein